ncbi:MAG: ABC transporter permease [Gaiella sp.]|nr:ABC transporter permease [Gaiella sp.]
MSSTTRESVDAGHERDVVRGRLYGVSHALRSGLSELWLDKAGLLGLTVIVLIIACAVFAPWLAPHEPSEQSLLNRLTPPFQSWDHPLGTDGVGKDELSQLLYGARTSLVVGGAVVLLSGTFGIVLGLFAGYRGGRWDSTVMRVVDVQVAFPGLLLALTILTVVPPSLKSVIVVLALNGWMVYARMTRGIVLQARETPYVEAAEIVGCKPRRVIFKHILPHLASPLLTLAVLEFAGIVVAEAALSFLGLGIQPPEVSWGLMVASGREYLFTAWWVATWPGIAISVLVLAVNLFASWLRVAADPQQRDRRFAQTSRLTQTTETR